MEKHKEKKNVPIYLPRWAGLEVGASEDQV